MRSKAVNIIFLIAGLTVAVLVLYGLRGRKKFDDKVSLRKKDNIPYGTSVAYRTLPDLFPGASISSSRAMPGSWDSLSTEEGHQAFICITGQFDPDEYELNKIIELVQAGNDVFISATELSYNAEAKLLQYQESTTVSYTINNRSGDSLVLTLLSPDKKTWQYPGKNNGYVFTRLDTSRAIILGEEATAPNFIQLNAGKGRLFLHRSPLAFSNYFLLHKNNFEYFERTMSYLSPGIKRIVWDEYFLTRRHKTERKESWFSVLMRYPGLSTAVIMGLIMLLIYAFAEMRRKQRIIPPYSRPANDSMDFVKTIGRLYFEKGDHRNLAKKMAAYFLEHVRSRYKISTGTLDEKFVKALQFKTGVDSAQIQAIADDINQLENQHSLSAQQLTHFYNKLENFYRTA